LAGGDHALENVLQEQDLGGVRLVIVRRLRLFALLAAEGRVHQHVIEKLRRAREQAGVGGITGQRIAVPDVRVVYAMEDEVGQGNGINGIVFLAAIERPVASESRTRGALFFSRTTMIFSIAARMAAS